MVKITLLFVLLLFQFLGHSQPPEPPIGHRWVLFDQYSDEFNDKALDTKKWRDTFNGWKGRPPAKFDPSTISVQNGTMQIKNKKLATPDGKYTIAGGAVQSLKQTAHFGYYEVKFKASKLSMSTTFWMSNGKKKIKGPTKISDDCQKDSWSQELDIIESVGGEFNQPWASGFRTKINFNTHYRYIDCNGSPEKFYSAGNNAIEGNGIKADATLVGGGESWEDFHTYGCYWRDSKTFDFYVDKKYAGTVIASTDVVNTPFSEPMGINMVTETYDFATPYPTDDQLSNNKINTSYYDWVRSYRLFAVNEPESSTIDTSIVEVFDETISFFKDPILDSKKNGITLSYLYKANQNRTLKVHIINNKNKEVYSQDLKVLEGYGKAQTQLNLKTSLPKGSYTITADIRSNVSSDTSVIAVTKGYTLVL